jgi:hypothetical protein
MVANLEFNGMPATQTLLHTQDGGIGMLVENVKVGDPVAREEGTRH